MLLSQQLKRSGGLEFLQPNKKGQYFYHFLLLTPMSWAQIGLSSSYDHPPILSPQHFTWSLFWLTLHREFWCAEAGNRNQLKTTCSYSPLKEMETLCYFWDTIFFHFGKLSGWGPHVFPTAHSPLFLGCSEVPEAHLCRLGFWDGWWLLDPLLGEQRTRENRYFFLLFSWP